MSVLIMKSCFLANLTNQGAINGSRRIYRYMHDIRELQPDVIVERYLDAKYYQHPPEQMQEMSECNSNATYLVRIRS